MRAGSAVAIATGSLLALAVAMGIGRFAFTPLLPLMQADFGLSVESGGWLAAANYAGYLVGALAATRLALAPLRAIVAGLVTIAVTTLAMGLTHDFTAWLAWRTLSGIASAFVLVFVSSWSVQRLTLLQRPRLSGLVFAGVGAGMTFAGLLCLALSARGTNSAWIWLILGAVAVLATLVLVPLLRAPGTAAAPTATRSPAPPFVFTGDAWRLVFCYGLYGFGYIIPATFLPVMAREALPDPAQFGWAWPLLGIAAMVSTVLGARTGNPLRARTNWALSHFVLAAGCAVPALVTTFGGVLIAALCVGATFVAITLYGVQEARNLAGDRARTLIGAMTTAFACGQMVGPLFVRKAEGSATPFTRPLLLAAVLLVVSGLMLLRRRRAATA